jgi:hypothetical protein
MRIKINSQVCIHRGIEELKYQTKEAFTKYSVIWDNYRIYFRTYCTHWIRITIKIDREV